jgi:hypothetical protein
VITVAEPITTPSSFDEVSLEHEPGCECIHHETGERCDSSADWVCNTRCCASMGLTCDEHYHYLHGLDWYQCKLCLRVVADPDQMWRWVRL